MASIYPTVLFDKLDEFLLEFEEHDQMIEYGVMATGPAAAYAEVWEWGNARQTKAGPKTVLGTNPDGEMVWLSSQAPFGYIRVNQDQFLEVVKIELGKVKFNSTNAAGITEELQKAGRKIMKEISGIIQDTAPVDTGQLRSSFKVVEDGDSLLDSDPGGRIESRFNRVLNIRERE